MSPNVIDTLSVIINTEVCIRLKYDKLSGCLVHYFFEDRVCRYTATIYTITYYFTTCRSDFNYFAITY